MASRLGPGNRLDGDGKVLFRSRRDHPHADFRVYTIDPNGGLPELIPLEPCAWLSQEPGGNRLAIQKIGLEFHNWKRYKGGEAEEIFVGTLAPLSFTEVAKYDGKDAFPMWSADGRIYFVTDRWGRPNLASMLPDGTDVRRLTNFTDYDVRWPSLGDGRIVYQHKMDIWSYDIASGKNEQVRITLPSDRLQLRERWVNPAETLFTWGLSNDGERIVLEARGDLFVTRTSKKGLIRRVTESSLVRTKFPSMSPDGKLIAAWTEVDGEEQLLLHSSDNSAAPRQVGKVEPGWHFQPAWSPDGKQLAYGDEKNRLLVVDVAAGSHSPIDTSNGEIRTYDWSPDSRYLAYEVALANGWNQVKIWDGKTKKSVEISDPMFDSGSPSWDPNGKYLVYLSDRVINPYLDIAEARFVVDNATVPVVVALQADGTLPFAARGDVDPKEANKKDEPATKGEKKKGKGPDKDERRRTRRRSSRSASTSTESPTRIVLVPVPAGNYSALRAIDGKLPSSKSRTKG